MQRGWGIASGYEQRTKKPRYKTKGLRLSPAAIEALANVVKRSGLTETAIVNKALIDFDARYPDAKRKALAVVADALAGVAAAPELTVAEWYERYNSLCLALRIEPHVIPFPLTYKWNVQRKCEFLQECQRLEVNPVEHWQKTHPLRKPKPPKNT